MRSERVFFLLLLASLLSASYCWHCLSIFSSFFTSELVYGKPQDVASINYFSQRSKGYTQYSPSAAFFFAVALAKWLRLFTSNPRRALSLFIYTILTEHFGLLRQETSGLTATDITATWTVSRCMIFIAVRLASFFKEV